MPKKEARKNHAYESKNGENSDIKKVKCKRKGTQMDFTNSSKTMLNNGEEQKLKELGNSKLEEDSSCDLANTSSGGYDAADQTITKVQSEKKNAFQIMMNSRTKSIGTNSPGKELVLQECSHINENKKKILSARRKILSDWADLKGDAKRKREEDKDEIIKHKLKKRTKRMKKLLNGTRDIDSLNESIDVPISENIIKKKPLRKLSFSSSSSDDNSSEDQKDEKVGNCKDVEKSKSIEELKENKIPSEDSKLVNENDKVGIENSQKLILNQNGNQSNYNNVNCSSKKKEVNKLFLTEESSQESLSTPPALRSWRMKIKLNLDGNKIEDNNEKQKPNILELSDDSDGK